MRKFFENSGGKPAVKKALSSILTVTTIASVTTAYGGSTGSTASTGGNAGEKEFSLKIDDDWGVTHPMAATLDDVLKKQIEEKSDGRTKADIYHDGLLGDEAALWQAVHGDPVDLTVVGIPMNQEFPMVLILDQPFLHHNLDYAKRTQTDPIADEISSKLHEKSPEAELLGWGPNSTRTFTSNKKLMSVEDFAGRKPRMPNSPVRVNITQNLGVPMAVIPLGELSTALGAGTVDEQDNGMVTVFVQSFQEVQKYPYEVNHIVTTLKIIVNTGRLEKISGNQCQIIRDAAKTATAQAWEDYIVSADKDRQTLINIGVTTAAYSGEDRTKIIEKTQPTTDKLLAKNDWAKGLTEEVKAVQ